MNVNSQLTDGLPAPQRLALSYALASARGATLGLLGLDARLSDILRGRLEPIAAQLRLAWWRDLLDGPPAEWPRGEPVLDALRDWGDPSGLSALPSGWEALLAEDLTTAVIGEFADGRGQAFASLAQELGVGSAGEVAQAGRVWALADLAAHLSEGAERQLVLDYARRLPPPALLPRALRPLAVLAGLGQRALQNGGGPLLSGPGSTLVALRIGFTGR